MGFSSAIRSQIKGKQFSDCCRFELPGILGITTAEFREMWMLLYICSHLRFTFISTCADLGFATPFAAVHRYLPAFLLLIRGNERDSKLTDSIPSDELPRNVQVTTGFGIPDALQNMVTFSVSFTVTSWEIKSIEGGTKTNFKRQC